MAAPSALIAGCQGESLSAPERALFRDLNPLGFILFARNCVNPGQVRALVGELRETVGRADAPVLIDQEGGRVQRLKPPHWRKAPAAAVFADIARTDPAAAIQGARINARLIADELSDLGITVDCLPVLDLPQPGADPIIGDRAAGDTPERAIALGRATCDGLMAGGVLPVIKHIPGHGRAAVDSHLGLPVVDATASELTDRDFAPFAALSDAPWAMTAHVVYSAFDPDRAATVSRRLVSQVIRGIIGFDGVLISDDIGMGALGGPFGQRVADALDAGCDVVLHCSGKLDEMQELAASVRPLDPLALQRLSRADAAVARARAPWDAAEGRARLARLLGDRAGV
jgi:beta-N-acetylhexosaminidase